MMGKISSGTEHGIKSMNDHCHKLIFFEPGLTNSFTFAVAVEFFNDILIPPELLMPGARL